MMQVSCTLDDGHGGELVISQVTIPDHIGEYVKKIAAEYGRVDRFMTAKALQRAREVERDDGQTSSV